MDRNGMVFRDPEPLAAANSILERFTGAAIGIVH